MRSERSMTDRRVEITTTLLNKVVKMAIQQALTIAGHGDAEWTVSNVSRTNGANGQWDAVLTATAEPASLARTALDDVREQYVLKA